MNDQDHNKNPTTDVVAMGPTDSCELPLRGHVREITGDLLRSGTLLANCGNLYRALLIVAEGMRQANQWDLFDVSTDQHQERVQVVKETILAGRSYYAEYERIQTALKMSRPSTSKYTN